MKKIIILISFVAVLVVGVAAGYSLRAKGNDLSASTEPSFLSKDAQQIKDRLLQDGAISDYANSLSGIVSSVSGNEVSFSAPLVNPFQNESLENRIAVISPSTKLYFYSSRSQEEINEALKVYTSEIEKLQKELNDKSAVVKECYKSGNISDCADEQNAWKEVQNEIVSLQAKTSSYEKKEITASDIQPGWSITAYAGRAATSSIIAEGLNIADEKKFNAVGMEFREGSSKKE